MPAERIKKYQRLGTIMLFDYEGKDGAVELLADLAKMIGEHEDVNLTSYADEDGVEMYFSTEILETQEEADRRVADQERMRAAELQHRRRDYEFLKRHFENGEDWQQLQREKWNLGGQAIPQVAPDPVVNAVEQGEEW